MSKASVEAYLNQINSGKRISDKAKIVAYLYKMKTADLQILRMVLGIKTETLSARISDLADDGIIDIKDVGERYSLISLASDGSRKRLIKEREQEKIHKLEKKAFDFGYVLTLIK